MLGTHAFAMEVQASLRDTDALGHVNNAVYLTWLELVRTRYVADRRRLTDVAEVDFVLASVTIDYRSPVYLMEWVELGCTPTRIGRASWGLSYTLRARQGGRLVAEASSVQVQYDYAARRSVPLPDDWRRLLEADVAAFAR